MDVQSSMGLEWTYFADSDYFAVLCWEHTTFSLLILLTKQSPISIIILSFWGAVGYMPVCFPCTQLMAAIDFSNTILPFIVTLYQPL